MINNITEICAAITGKYGLFLVTTLKSLGIIALILAIVAMSKIIWELFKNDSN